MIASSIRFVLQNLPALLFIAALVLAMFGLLWFAYPLSRR